MPTRRVHLVWDERFTEYDFGAGHPFSEVSRSLAVRLLTELRGTRGIPGDGLVAHTSIDPAPRAVLERFHRPEYLNLVARRDAAEDRRPLDRGDTPSFPGCYDASARLVGGTLRALELAAEADGRAFQPGGGLHHAHPDRASGFCIFNDLATAIADHLARNPHGRVAYVDIDAHHGDGVMYGFYEDGRVLDIDFHQDGRTIFPGTGFPQEHGRGDGAGLKVNVPLPPGTGEVGVTRLFERLVPALLESFRPDVIVLQCGVDGHTGDQLGATALEYAPTTYRYVVRRLDEVARELGRRPLVITGGGGYTPAHVARVLASVPLELLQGAPKPEETLPEAWRSEFEHRTGQPAPRDWSAAAHPDRWAPSVEAGIVRALESALGRSFSPPPEHAGTPARE